MTINMASRSNIHCCVPLCNQKGTIGPNGEKVGFFSFPKDASLKKVWLAKIRRDPGKNFNLNENTKYALSTSNRATSRKDTAEKCL